MKILIVDDNLIQRMVLEYNLKKCNYQIQVAVNGKEALLALENQVDIELVITDIMMPNINGLELLGMLRSNPRLNSIPVILCTALSDSENIQKAAQLGCRFYLVKPIQVQIMLEKVQEVLQDRKRVLRDFEESQRKLGMDPSAFYPLMVGFEKFVNEKIGLVQQKLQSSDMDSIRGDLVTLYENAVLLGAERLSSVLADIQSGVNMSITADEDYQTMLNELKTLSSLLAKKIADHRSVNCDYDSA